MAPGGTARGDHGDTAIIPPPLLVDRDRPGRYVIEVDFSSEEEAQKNDARPETQSWAQKLRGVAQGEPEYSNFEVAYRAQ